MTSIEALTDELDDELAIEFDEPVEQSPWLGLNPNAAGYRIHARRHRVILHLIAAGVVVAAISLIVVSSRIATGLPIAMLIGAVTISVLAEVNWRLTAFCPNCGARVQPGIRRTHNAWCPGCMHLAFPNDVLPESDAPHNLMSVEWIIDTDPYLFLVTQVLTTVIAERGARLSFRKRNDTVKIVVEQNGTTWEFEEPPSFVWFPVAQIMRAICGVASNSVGEQQQGHTSFTCSGALAEAQFTFHASEVNVEFQYQANKNAA